jgi:NAD(P)-dependent dehydrogenase (short-subunit alcohol dehydrogenase family)
MKLKGKVAIITGGSRGIGRSIAEAFLQNGARVAIAARSIEDLEKTLIDLQSDGDIICIPTDVSKGQSVRNMVEQTICQYGHIDILVNSAGIQAPIGPLIKVDIEEWINNVHINFIGTVLCCKYVLPFMVSKKKGKIINMSGGGATGARPNFSAYACSKTAIVRFTEILALEVKDQGIEVNCVAPGAVNTNMLKEIIDAGDLAGDKELKEAKDRLGKGGIPPKVPAELVLFLASEESNGITGKLISAPWDNWKSLDFQNRLRFDSDFGTLRRIDDMFFFKR